MRIVVVPLVGFYCASKWAVETLHESLAQEVPRLRRVRAKPRSLPKPSFLVRNMSPDRWLSVALKIPRIPRSGSERKACSVAQHASNLSRVDYDDQTLVYIQTTAARIDHFRRGTPFYRATFYASEKR